MVSSSEVRINNRYRLHEKLGEGGMGAVYRATDRLTGKEVALKRVVLAAPTASDSDTYDIATLQIALAREFQVLASLRHPHIIGVQDYGFATDSFDEDGAGKKLPYFVMPLLDNAQTIFQAAGQQTDTEIVKLLIQLLQALAYLHRRGILHRDLKPGNVLVVDGQVKVLDFGLSTPRDHDHTKGIVGTLAYLAPEVLRGEPSSEASDLYAVGVIAYELLTGKLPFSSSTAKGLIQEVLNSEPSWEPLINQDKTVILPTNVDEHRTELLPGIALPEMETIRDPSVAGPVMTFKRPDFTQMLPKTELGGIVQRLLIKNPSRRYSDVNEVMHDLCLALDLPHIEESEAIRESFLQRAAFVGRETELNTLTIALQRAINRQGSAWLIGGESGVGKSRLIDELSIRAMVEGMLVLFGQGIAEGGMIYQLWRNPLRRIMLHTEISDIEASILQAIIPDLASLIGRKIIALPELDQHTTHNRLVNTITALFRRHQQPILLIMEDLQWATESLQVLKAVSEIVDDCPLLIVASYRSDSGVEVADKLPQVKHIELQRLADDDIAALSVSMLGDVGKQASILQFLQQQTEGNVFFLVEIVRSLAESAGRLEDIAQLSLPENIVAGGIASVIERRLSLVPDKANELLKLAAVAGRRLDLNILEHLNSNNIDLDMWLVDCINAAVFDYQGGQWRFGHDKLREGVLERIDDEERPLLHRQVAMTIETVYDNPKEFAIPQTRHWRMAGDQEKELHYGTLAGTLAYDTSSYPEARRYFERALELLAPDRITERADVLWQLGRIEERLSNFEISLEYYTNALALTRELDDVRGVARALNGIGGIHEHYGKYDAAEENYQQSLEYYLSVNDQDGESTQIINLANVAKFRGDAEKAISLYQQAIQLARLVGNKREESRALGNLGSVYHNVSRFEETIAAYQQSLSIKREVGDRTGESVTLGNLGSVYRNLGDDEKALACYEQAIIIKEDIGDRLGKGIVLGNLANTFQDNAYLDKAIDTLGQAYAISQAVGDRLGDGYNLGNMGNCYHDLGEFKTAIDHYTEAITIIQELKARRTESYFLGMLGKAYHDIGQWDAAIDTFHAALAICEELNDPRSECYALTYLGETHLANDELDQAHEALRKAAAIANQLKVPDLISSTCYVLVQLYLRRAQYQKALVAVAITRRFKTLADYHRIEALLGLTLLRLDRDNAAQEAFQAAIKLANDLLRRTPNFYTAHQTLALSYTGLGVLGNREAFIKANQFYQRVRDNWDGAGVIAESRRLLETIPNLGHVEELVNLWQILTS